MLPVLVIHRRRVTALRVRLGQYAQGHMRASLISTSHWCILHPPHSFWQCQGRVWRRRRLRR